MSDNDRDELLGEAADELRREHVDDLASGDGKGGGKKKQMLILLPILLLGGAGASIYFSGILGNLGNLGNIARETDQAPAVVEPISQNSIFFDLPEMLVNLNSVGARPSFLKLQASLELDEGTDTTLLSILKPRIIDKFHVYMRELRLNDLRANGGLYRLREELRVEINRAVSPIEVKQVLFRNILVQ